MPDTDDITPIACTLDAGSLKERLAWIADLNRRALLASHRDDLRLTLTYDPSTGDDVRRMVAGEQSCCAFLLFDVTERTDAVTVTITAPEDARAAAEALFEPFARRSADAAVAACGCRAGCGA
ncbi:hypothetical protein HLH34_10845 [Gluconacetobacter azotocaptans]|uniref:Uncharacterized protein n=1 Tax=Gluconacetobacter azotocaptans TaxID=142834 RepID=A0A7W4PE51_9PROT|nr:hypothetical protein [Gluconacetobacter azotocaptans]MBB2190453.1 hypothetical protein [Gluconacetobacter azotocaptans]MBM9400510.1 hypothetical protein [Gluconacetobacter azotocaptans]GBQ26510.1 hypothetical protein AA13594_0271 [Gluconacetobacter azotocaptans DSM 13594]